MAAHGASGRGGDVGIVLPRDREPQRRREIGGVAPQLVGLARDRGGEQPQHLRGAHEQVGHQRRRAEQQHQPLGDQPLVAQQPQVPGRAGQRLGHPAVGQEAAVGIRAARELVQQDGQERLLDRRGARHPAGERTQVAERAVWRGPAQRAEPGRGLTFREPARVGGQPRHRGEQRPVEQLLVQAAHAAGVARPLGHEDADDVVPPVGPQLGRTGQPPQRVRVVGGRQQVGAAQPLQLQPVLQQPQEPVGRGEVRPVVAPDVAAVRQRRERVEGRPRAQGLVGAPVHQLQELHRELDVAQAAGAELDLARALVGPHVLLDAAAHGLHVADEVGPARRVPDHRRDGLGVSLAQLRVARHGARLEQRLELPGLGPALVVGDVAVERAHQRALAAFGAQVGVDLEAGLAQDPHHPRGEPGGVGVGGLGDEHDVDVAHVVQLAATALAHRDDGQPARIAVGLGHRDGQGGPQRGGGQVGEPGRHVLDVEDRELGFGDGGEVGRGQHHQLVAVGGAQGLDGRRPGEPGRGAAGPTRVRRVRVGADGRQQGRRGVVLRTARPVAQPVPAVRVGREVVGQDRRAAQQGEQPPAQLHLGADRRIELPAVGHRGNEPLDRPQREIGVGAAGQRPHHVLGALHGPVARPPAQLGERGLRPGLGQPQSGEGSTGARHTKRSCPIAIRRTPSRARRAGSGTRCAGRAGWWRRWRRR